MPDRLIWLFVLSMVIVYIEEGDLRWATIRTRLRLNAPREPQTGKPRLIIFLWVIPFLIGVVLVDVVLSGSLEQLWTSIFPFLAAPPGYNFGDALGMPEIQVQLAGAWWFLALFFIFALFNTILGEELLFRGVLLPKMNAVFGRWDWVANALLFGCYHLHQPWGIPGAVIDGLLFTYPAYRYRSTWMSIILHSGQSVFFFFLILGLVLGLA